MIYVYPSVSSVANWDGEPAIDCEIIFGVDSTSYNEKPAESHLTRQSEETDASHVREARPSDVQAIMELERQTATAAHWRGEDYERLFEHGGVARVALVVECQESLAGFIVVSETGGEWELENIVVEPKRRGRGIGSKLMQAFLDVARERGGGAVFLEVRESNVTAREFYRRWGFEEVGMRKRYYSGPEEDGVVYRLALGEFRREK